MKYYSFMGPDETDFLVETAKTELKNGGTYIEMGVFAMGTIAQIAEAVPHATCWAVDLFDHRYLDDVNNSTRKLLEDKFPEQEWTNATVMTMIKMANALPNVHSKVGRSRSLFIKNTQMQFLDADHSYEETHADFWHAWSQAAPGSLIVGHDIQFDGVNRAVRDISKVLGNPGYAPGTLWTYRKT